MTKHSRRAETAEEVPQERVYKFSDLQKEMRGISIGHMSLAGALQQTLGAENAVKWFYHVSSPEFKHKTPAQYIVENGSEGRMFIASSLYFFLTGQPD